MAADTMHKPLIMTENYFREFFAILFARRRVILDVTLLMFLIGVVITLFYPPSYAAYAALLVRGKEAEKELQTLERIELRRFPITEQDLYSEVETLQSPDVIRRALAAMAPGDMSINSQVSSEQVKEVLSRMETEVVPASNVIRVSLRGADPGRTVELLEALINQYAQYRTELRKPNTAAAFLKQQAERYELNLKRMQDRLLKMAEESGAAEPEMEVETNLLLKRDLRKLLSVLQQAVIEKRGNIEILDTALAQTRLQYFSAVENKAVNRLAEKLIDLTVEWGQLARIYSQESAAVQKVNKQIDLMYGELKAEISSYTYEKRMELDIISQKMEEIERQIAAIDARNMELNHQRVQRDAIRREANVQETSFQTFAKRREEAHMDTTLNSAALSNFVSVLTHAYASDGPVFPRPELVVPLGLVVGLFLGLTVGFVGEFFSHTFKRPEDVERYAGLPVLFSIPDLNAPRVGSRDRAQVALVVAAAIISAGVMYWKPLGEAWLPLADAWHALMPAPAAPQLGANEHGARRSTPDDENVSRPVIVPSPRPSLTGRGGIKGAYGAYFHSNTASPGERATVASPSVRELKPSRREIAALRK